MRRREFLPDTIYGYEAVDMGTNDGVLWATCNIGAHSPEETGLYFAWGEVQGYKMEEELQTTNWTSANRYGDAKKYWNWIDYKWCSGSSLTMTKYCVQSNYGTVDNITTLELEDDAAYKLMGKGWRIPTQQECANLINACTYTSDLDEYKGVQGKILTSKTTKNSIFVPVSGQFNNGGCIDSTVCYFWSSLINTSVDYYAHYFLFSKLIGAITTSYTYRHGGIPIRGVLTELSPVNSDYVDLGLSVHWAICNIGAQSETDYGLYFAWGEIQGYSADEIGNYNSDNRYGQIRKCFDWSDYKWCNKSDSSIDIRKYNPYDNKTTLDPEDDAAYQLMGRRWRMPTTEEFVELNANCIWKWTTINGVAGMEFTLKKNSKSVFFPAAGFSIQSTFQDVRYVGYYWSSSNYTNSINFSYSMSFNNNNILYSQYYFPRFVGYSVRGVLDYKSL